MIMLIRVLCVCINLSVTLPLMNTIQRVTLENVNTILLCVCVCVGLVV